jgi:hypothetical protein
MLLVSRDSSIKDEFDLGNLNLFVLESEHFKDLMPIDLEGNREDWIKFNTKGFNQEWITVLGHGHLHPCDWSALSPDFVAAASTFKPLPFKGEELCM